jgi:hypothetical protein
MHAMLYVRERLDYSACGWGVTFPLEIFLINLRQIPVGCFIRKKFLIKPSQWGLAGKVSHYRHLEEKKFRLHRCWTNRTGRGLHVKTF